MLAHPQARVLHCSASCGLVRACGGALEAAAELGRRRGTKSSVPGASLVYPLTKGCGTVATRRRDGFPTLY